MSLALSSKHSLDSSQRITIKISLTPVTPRINREGKLISQLSFGSLPNAISLPILTSLWPFSVWACRRGLDVYPWQENSKGLKPQQPFFIDLGGGIGQQSVALREKLPQLPNRIIVQDIPATLQHAIKHPSVETMVQEFFQPQVLKGRSRYFSPLFIPLYNVKNVVCVY
jgi:hypothetical protein